MIHFENIYLEAAGREQQSEGKKSTGVKSRGAGRRGGRRERGIARMGGNQGSEITKNPGAQQLAPVVLDSLSFSAERSSAAMARPSAGAQVYTR